MRRGDEDELPEPGKRSVHNRLAEARLAENAALMEKAERKLLELRSGIRHSLPHDIRTPLAGLLGFAEIIADQSNGYTTLEMAAFGKTIYESGKRLQKIVEDYLTYVQIELAAGEPSQIAALRSSEYNDAAEVIQILAGSVAEMRGRQTDVTVDVMKIPVAIAAEHLKRITTELLENAFAFSEKGTEVYVAMSSRNGEFVLTIADRSSTALPPDIDGPVTSDPSMNKSVEKQRAGLGLTIARRLAEVHGGRLEFTATPGGGLTGTLSLPILPQARADGVV